MSRVYVPIPTAYTKGELRMFPIIVSLKAPFLSQEPVPLPPAKALYIADFLIMRRLDVEVDGESHETEHRSMTDDRRDKVLKQLGYPTVRFTDEDTFHAETCAKKIREEIGRLPEDVKLAALQPAGSQWGTPTRGW